jgi:hypothetical protein
LVEIPSILDNKISKLTNSGPPIFEKDLEDLELTGGENYQIELPKVIDSTIEPAKTSIKFDLGEAITFIERDDDGKFNAGPDEEDYRNKPYKISITLSNPTAIPESSIYEFNIYLILPEREE